MGLSALVLFYCTDRYRYKANAVSVFGVSHWLTKPFLSGINSRRSDSANTRAASLNSVTNLDWAVKFKVSYFPSKMLLNSWDYCPTLFLVFHVATANNFLHVSAGVLLYCAYSMEQSPSWEANRFQASQEIPRILRNPKFHYHIHKCLPLSLASSIQSLPPHPASWRSV